MSCYEADRLDRLAYLDSPAHRLDPRAKLLATLAFVVAVVSFPKYEVSALAPFVFFPLLLAGAGGIPLGMIAWPLSAAVSFSSPSPRSRPSRWRP